MRNFTNALTKDNFAVLAKTTPYNFLFLVKASERVTRGKRPNVDKEAITLLEEFLDKISLLKNF